jgi:hypothetical protein
LRAVCFRRHQAISAEFDDLNQKGRSIAEYVWIGGSGQDIRSKA